MAQPLSSFSTLHMHEKMGKPGRLCVHEGELPAMIKSHHCVIESICSANVPMGSCMATPTPKQKRNNCSFVICTHKLSLFHDTDLTLTTERLVELFASMTDWSIYSFALNLEIPLSKREEIMVNYQSPTQQKEAYLDYYVHSNPLASWVKIADILHLFGLPQQTNVVESTYIKGMHLLWVCIYV